MRRREIQSPLISSVRHAFVVPVPPTTEPELSAYNAGKQTAQSDSPSCPNPNMTPGEREAFTLGVWAGEEMSQLRAPLSWPLEIVLLTSSILVSARLDSSGQGFASQTRLAVRWLPIMLVTSDLKAKLEQQRVLALGLTAETAPHPKGSCGAWTTWIAPPLTLRLLGFRYKTPSWPRRLAAELIREIDRRRAWSDALHSSLRE